jgi:acetoacetate decarboxylase
MTRDEILGASSMPLASPSYPKGPFRFIKREYLLIHYETDQMRCARFCRSRWNRMGTTCFSSG